MCNRGGLIFNLGSVAVASSWAAGQHTADRGTSPVYAPWPPTPIPNTRVPNTIPGNLLCASHRQLRRIELHDAGSQEDLQGRARRTRGQARYTSDMRVVRIVALMAIG